MGAIVAVGLTIMCHPCGLVAMTAIGGVAGAVGAAANGSNILRGAALGAFSGWAAGGGGWMGAAVAGGFSAAALGGDARGGFAAAGIGAYMGGVQGDWSFVAAAVGGGLASEVTGGKFKNGAATGAFMWALSRGISKAQDSSSGAVEYYDKAEDGAEFEWETRSALKENMKGQAGEMKALIAKAKSGDTIAVSALEKFYGDDLDFVKLEALAADLTKASESFRSYKFVKLGQPIDGERAYACVICPGEKQGRIYLSKTAVNDALSGNAGKYTLLHEVAHFSARYGHPKGGGHYSRVKGLARSGGDTYGDIYAFQGAMRSYYYNEL